MLEGASYLGDVYTCPIRNYQILFSVAGHTLARLEHEKKREHERITEHQKKKERRKE